MIYCRIFVEITSIQVTMGAKMVNIEHIAINSNQSFKCKHYHVPLNDVMPIHKHKEWEISWIIKGEGSRITGNSLEPIKSDEIVILPPGLPHCWIFNQNQESNYTENITIQFDEDLINKQLLLFNEFSSIAKFKEKFGGGAMLYGEVTDKVREYILQINQQNDESRLLTFIAMMLLLSQTMEYRALNIIPLNHNTSVLNSEQMEKVLKYISRNYMQDITLEQIANIASMSKGSFCSFFKKNTRVSFVNYLSQYRIEIAAQLLREDNRSIANICFDVGFNDIPHFNRIFKRILGVSPSKYRVLDMNASAKHNKCL